MKAKPKLPKKFLVEIEGVEVEMTQREISVFNRKMATEKSITSETVYYVQFPKPNRKGLIIPIKKGKGVQISLKFNLGDE